MANQDISMIAHLMRRAGFGAPRAELEARAAKGYEATVEELLHPETQPPLDRNEMMRYHPWTWRPGTLPGMGAAEWLHDMVNTKRPLEEKMALFWHQVFATGVSKVDHYDDVMDMIVKFREKGMGDYRELLIEMAKDPAMIYWLDNCENHATAVNENWGRELLELFSMGVGNYTETDVRECSRAFTGWTILPKLPRGPIGRHDWFFEYREEDHDDSEKTFLGVTGNLNGEDIIRIICEQPATSRFVARHLYNFFVADEAQVPAWSVTPPRDPAAINLLSSTLVNSNYDIRSTLRVLFNADFFKDSLYARLKSPAEVVVGTLRLVGHAEFPAPGLGNMSRQAGYMGQDLLNPPSVEGWHTGAEWINSGSLMQRVNFTAELVSDVRRPGIQAIVDRLQAQGTRTTANVVDSCLDLLGPLDVSSSTRDGLIGFSEEGGDFRWDTAEHIQTSTARVAELLQLIVATREYQFA
ncbi:MAG: DUF1800 domain-containing protein [Candidatus Tectomicrobia bacterium]|uniref:DUF1800 domain-containing protein n=1 Tax=Tectimicrobiota bacterium TaxID=2528274 RepID=A0A938B322_UNCTE|nr:DUF1800 domain-containing protein [Candidatus Tectomicrobia bacterium]